MCQDSTYGMPTCATLPLPKMEKLQLSRLLCNAGAQHGAAGAAAALQELHATQVLHDSLGSSHHSVSLANKPCRCRTHRSTFVATMQERSMGQQRPHVPYRNSMMTQVLRDSLGGNCRTVMIANITAQHEQLDESISTCRFAQRVAMVSNQVRS